MEELNQDIEYPEDYSWYWDWYWELAASRQAGFSGPQPITYEEIYWWSQSLGRYVTREEIFLLKDMDIAYRNALNEEVDAQRKRREALSQ